MNWARPKEEPDTLAETLLRFLRERSVPVQPRPLGAAQNRPRLSALTQRAIDHIEHHYATELTIGKLATHALCSREHLARRFRADTGVTVHVYLTSIRMSQAAILLRNGEKIEAVALMVGYRGKRNFFSHFKICFGMTPGQYRTLYRTDGLLEN